MLQNTKNKDRFKGGDYILGGFVIIVLIVIVVSTRGFSQSSSIQPEKKPNIVFILVDDMGWKDLGTYGSSFYETPNIDRLASQGMKFTNAYASSPKCSPSRSSIMTGQYPVHTGITDYIIGTQNGIGPQPTQKLLPREFTMNLPKSEVTIAQALKDNGYVTFFAGKWHLGLSPKYWPKHEGFDYNYGGWRAGSPTTAGMGGYFSPWNNPRLKNGPKGTFLTDRLTTKTIQFIKKEAKAGRPFFADLSFYAVHEPIEAKKKYIKKFKRKVLRLGLDTLKQVIRDSSASHRGWKPVMTERIVQDNPVYAGLIYSVDQNVGRIMATLKKLEITKNTIVVFTSDNGGLATSEGMPTSNLPLRYGKGWLYDGGLRVPLIIKWPGVTKAGSIAKFPVINTDFYPTFLQMAGVPPMPQQDKDGVSMVPLLKGKKSIEQPVLYWHFPHYSNQKGTPSSAIQEGLWKLIQFYNNNHVELYNLRIDIGERYNLVKKFPQKTASLLYKLNKWKQRTHAKIPKINPSYNPDYKKVLKKKHEAYQQFIKIYQSQFGKDVYLPMLKKKLLKRYHKKYPQLQ
jgi:arylsulfatase A-like enzyme